MSVTITARTVKSGRRFIVRYRLGGRAFQQHHAGSFRARKEAEARRDIIAGEIAHGRDPQLLLASLAAVSPVRRETFETIAERYRQSRVDIGAETRKNMESHIKLLNQTFGDQDPNSLTWQTVQDWISGVALKPSSVKRYTRTLRTILDYAGVEPNPAKDDRVRLPKEEHVEINPPSAKDVEAIVLNVPERWRLAITTLAESGMRVGELSGLVWGDVDEAKLRFRVKHGKTKAARRWVAVPEELMVEVTRSVAPDDRTSDRPVFTGCTPDVIKNVMDRACKSAGIAHYHPHDLRHRYISVQLSRGVPVANVAQQVGHVRQSITWDVYSHVIIDD